MFKKSFIKLLIIVLSIPLFAIQLKTNNIPLQLNSLFTDHMVLQQSKSVAFWGVNTPYQKVTVSGSWGMSETTTTDSYGKWKLNILSPKAGGPYVVTVQSNNTSLSINDVLIGEVWLSSGQSNMEMPLKGWAPNDVIDNAEEEIAKSVFPEIRMFTVERQLSLDPKNTFEGNWKVSNPETAGNFSASAYFFARKLHKELNVPIGIIHSSWGGTPAEAWTSHEQIKKLGDFNDILTTLDAQNQHKAIIYWFSKWKTVSIPSTDAQWNNLDFNDYKATQLDYNDSHWNNMNLPGRIDDIADGKVDGVIWFRKNVYIEDVDTDYTLTIGAIDDMDATYINGHKIGGFVGSGHSSTKREFTIPKSLLVSGKNTIAIRAIDVGGPGSFAGPMELTNTKGLNITLTGNWKYKLVAEIYQNQFYVYGIEKSDIEKRTTVIKLHPKLPSVLYNAMIHPLIPFTIKGVIWYQGEENVGRAAQYKRLFPAMIEDWRTQWNYDFPFYFVQIAPFQYNGNNDVTLDKSQKLRDAQRQALNTKNTGMVVTIDIGNFNNIHPSNKQDIGMRLAGLALANDYGKHLIPSGPLFKSLKVSMRKIILDFDYIGSGLIAKGDLLGFEIAGVDKKFVFANATIVGNKIELSANPVSKPLYARYAWKDKAVPSLFNKEGLPATSFTTE
jgi:sialate O-acetylesterase